MQRSFAEHRLPRGRHGIPREQVEASQRWRLLGACAEVLRERGYARTTVALVAKEAAVSKAAFYRYFDGLGSCILETYRVATEGFVALLSEACDEPRDPGAGVAHAIDSVFEYLAAEPSLACVLTDGALDDVTGLASSRAKFVERCALFLARAGHRRAETDGDVGEARYLILGVQGLLGGGASRRDSEVARELAWILALIGR